MRILACCACKRVGDYACLTNSCLGFKPSSWAWLLLLLACQPSQTQASQEGISQLRRISENNIVDCMLKDFSVAVHLESWDAIENALCIPRHTGYAMNSPSHSADINKSTIDCHSLRPPYLPPIRYYASIRSISPCLPDRASPRAEWMNDINGRGCLQWKMHFWERILYIQG